MPVSAASRFGWATYFTLHQAVAMFSQSLIWSWNPGPNHIAGAPEGPHEFVMEKLAALRLPDGIEVEAQLTNELEKTRSHQMEATEIEAAHRSLRLMAWLCRDCIRVAKEAFPEQDLLAMGWKQMGRKDAARALDISQNSLDNWKNKKPEVVRHIRAGMYLVNPAHIKKHDETR